MGSRFGAAAVAVAIFTLPLDASAATMISTFQGEVISGVDGTGLFLTPGASLDGLAFTLSYRVDTSRGNRTTDPTMDLVEAHDAASPATLVTLTIGQRSYSFAPDYSFIFNSNNGSEGTAFRGAWGDSNQTLEFISTNIQIAAYSLDIPVNIDVPFFVLSNGPQSQRFSITHCTVPHFICSDTEGYLHVSSLAVTAAPAPEPSTWLLLFVGVGIAGQALRSGRAVRA